MSVAFVREESAEAAQEVSLPPRAISAQPNPASVGSSAPSPTVSGRSKPGR